MARMTKTTLTAAVTATDKQISVASATGIAVGSILMIDRELMKVEAIDTLVLTVARGTFPGIVSAHVTGSLVLVGTADQFIGFDKSGYEASPALTPLVNVNNGKIFHNVAGVWVEGRSLSIGQTTNYGLSPSIWNDCPLDKMLVDPGYGFFDGDDFTGSSGSPVTTAHKYVWSGANGAVTQIAANPGGAWLLNAPGTDNDEIYMHSNIAAGLIKADAVSEWWFEARIKINQITLAQGVFVGLHEENSNAVSNMTDNTMALAVLDYIGFQIISATDVAAIWQTVHAINAGAHAVVSATGATASASYVKLGMKSIAGVVTFYVDGVPLATTVASTATNFPLDQVMQVAFMTKCGQATQNTLTVDWWKAAQTRLAN